jgi:hypothetical protein
MKLIIIQGVMDIFAYAKLIDLLQFWEKFVFLVGADSLKSIHNLLLEIFAINASEEL